MGNRVKRALVRGVVRTLSAGAAADAGALVPWCVGALAPASRRYSGAPVLASLLYSGAPVLDRCRCAGWMFRCLTPFEAASSVRAGMCRTTPFRRLALVRTFLH